MGPSGEKGECLTVNLNDSNTEKGAPGGVRGPQGQKGEPGLPGVGGSSSTGGGVTYVRWGKSTCPDVLGTVMLYSGISAGTKSHYNRRWNELSVYAPDSRIHAAQ